MSGSSRYLSTRGGVADAGFDEVLLNGLAPDGGLYLPHDWPTFAPELGNRPYAEIATQVLRAFAGDALSDAALVAAAQTVASRFDHPDATPLVELGPDLWLMELFHGPTMAFKDCAMQLMAPLLDAALAKTGERLLLLTATSGDTGAAAVRAFAGADRVELAVLHPKGRVSPVQRLQMTTTDAPNVLNLAVESDFDDCQRMVKALLGDPSIRAGRRVSSVNSINWGRLAGQVPYYLRAAAKLARPDGPVRFVVPTGNLGDAFAGWAAKASGAPIAPLTAAVNSNDALARAINEGRYVRRAAVATASVSMDVQAPSNFERLVFEATGRDADQTRAFFETFAKEGAVDIAPGLLAALRAEVSAFAVDEAETAAEIARTLKKTGRFVCPHTAVALAAARRLPADGGPIVALATAHPAKFPESVAAAAGAPPPTPDAIAALAGKKERVTVIAPDVDAAKAALEAAFAAV